MHFLNIGSFIYALAIGTNVKSGSLLSSKDVDSTSVTTLAQDVVKERQEAVVVGGGPVGLAAALVLAGAPHNYDVTVYESSDGDTSNMCYDVSKAYLYHVNRRGQTFTSKFPSIQNRLEKFGVPTSATVTRNSLLIVPGDPNVITPQNNPTTEMELVRSEQEKSKSSVEESTIDKGSKEDLSGHWIPRHMMVVIMHEAIKEYNESRSKDSDKDGKITYISGKECVSVSPLAQGDKPHKVTATFLDKNDNKNTITHEANLVVGADGINSKVRNCLFGETESFKSWPNHKNKKFQVRKWTSPATDLKLRALQFPPQFEIPIGDGTSMKSNGETMYALASVNTGRLDTVRLGLLPMKNNTSVRPANVIARPNHDVWKIQDGESMRAWFEKSFPRFPFQKGSDMVPQAEWDRFAKANALQFPTCQYSPGLQTCSPDNQSGIVLLGDSSHAFPPDIGQGINAGFTDVLTFDRALRGVDLISGEKKSKAKQAGEKDPSQIKPKLGEALKEYERVRSPELKALIRLARFGAPYQYKQPLRRDRILRKFWTMNIALRLLLNKLSFGLIPKPAIIMATNENLTYRQLMRGADGTTLCLRLFFVCALAKLLKFV